MKLLRLAAAAAVALSLGACATQQALQTIKADPTLTPVQKAELVFKANCQDESSAYLTFSVGTLLVHVDAGLAKSVETFHTVARAACSQPPADADAAWYDSATKRVAAAVIAIKAASGG